MRDLGPLINVREFKKPVYSFYVASLVVNTLALFTVGNNAAQKRLSTNFLTLLAGANVPHRQRGRR